MREQIKLTVKDILEEIYFNDNEKAFKELQKHNFTDIVDSKLQFLKIQLNTGNSIDLNTFSVTFLQGINSKLSEINNSNTVEELKYYLSDIGNYLIDSFIKNKIVSIKELQEIESSLKSTSQIEGYDYNDLNKRIQLNRIIEIIDSQNRHKDLKNNIEVYYEWIGKDYILYDISDNLISEKTISSVKEFNKLFTPSPIKVRFSIEKRDFIFVLFETLYNKKLIKPRGRKGKFNALQKHSVDFENKILFKKEPKYHNYEIKKDEANYLKLKKKAENWINQLTD